MTNRERLFSDVLMWLSMNPDATQLQISEHAADAAAAIWEPEIKRLRYALEAADDALDNLHDNASDWRSYDEWKKQVDRAKAMVKDALVETKETNQ